jgi:hypothetical protein
MTSLSDDWKKYEREIQKAMSGNDGFVKIDNCTIDGCTGWHYISYTGNSTNSNVYISNMPIITNEDFIPVKIIYNCPATICYFKDGTKEVVKCAEDEDFIKEVGVMACIMKKIFKSRHQFVKLVEAGYENTDAIYERNAHNAILKRSNRNRKDQWG